LGGGDHHQLIRTHTCTHLLWTGRSRSFRDRRLVRRSQPDHGDLHRPSRTAAAHRTGSSPPPGPPFHKADARVRPRVGPRCSGQPFGGGSSPPSPPPSPPPPPAGPVETTIVTVLPGWAWPPDGLWEMTSPTAIASSGA